MRLVVFFSRGMSLEGWQRAGILDREMALYRALRPHLEHLAFVSYGSAADQAIASGLDGVDVLTNRWRLPSNLYSVAAPWLHRRTLRDATIFKTNQLNGAWSAVIAAHRFRKKLVVRCGFLWADFVARLHPRSWRETAARRLERQACRAADVVIVAAAADRQSIVGRYQLDPERVHVIPNYVDTTLFRPMSELVREPGRVTFVGRLDEQKNLRALLDAVADLPGIKLTIVGDGPLRTSLEADAVQRGIDVTFLGARPQSELPAILNRSSAFVLPSHYEGNPKALVEAMACGVPVIGARVPGIQEILMHRETGYLCGLSSLEIRQALRDVLDSPALIETMTAGAMAYVRSTCSLESAVARELALLRAL